MKKNFIVIRLTIVVLSVIIYCICLYAALTGKIEFLQVITEKRSSRGIFGYTWMIYGILASVGFYLAIESVWDYFKIFEWRKKYSPLVCILECVIPIAIMIVLNFYKRYGEAAGPIGALTSAVLLFFILMAEGSNIIKFIKKKISEAKKEDNVK